MKYKVPFIKPNFPSSNDIKADYDKILENNWFTNFGPFEKKFAEEVGNYIGKEYFCATFSSATSALIASILAVLGRGNYTKYVLVPSFTFAACADALIWCGYKPLFIDIETKGLHMNLTIAKEAINQNTGMVAGILFCNAFGVGSSDIEAWEVLSKKTDTPLVIDSAAGFGSLYSKSRRVGSGGLCEIFSFHATKPFAIGEGGAVVSRNKHLINNLLSIQNFGFNTNRDANQLGFNGKLQEINAAIGLRQIKGFNTRLEMRKKIFNRYRTELNSDRFTFQINAERASLCFASVIINSADQRDKYLSKLAKVGVEAKTYYSPPLHKQTYFKDEKIFLDLNNTEQISGSIVSLPIHDNMFEPDVSLIIETLNS